MSRILTVRVQGRTKSGKSTITKIIADALDKAGFKDTIQFYIDGGPPPDEQMDMRVESLKKAGLKINIIEEQLARPVEKLESE